MLLKQDRIDQTNTDTEILFKYLLNKSQQRSYKDKKNVIYNI